LFWILGNNDVDATEQLSLFLQDKNKKFDKISNIDGTPEYEILFLYDRIVELHTDDLNLKREIATALVAILKLLPVTVTSPVTKTMYVHAGLPAVDKNGFLKILNGDVDKIPPSTKGPENGYYHSGKERATVDGIIIPKVLNVYRDFGFNRCVCGHTHFNGINVVKTNNDKRVDIDGVHTVLSSSIVYEHDKKNSKSQVGLIYGAFLKELPARYLVVTEKEVKHRFFDVKSACDFFFEAIKREFSSYKNLSIVIKSSQIKYEDEAQKEAKEKYNSCDTCNKYFKIIHGQLKLLANGEQEKRSSIAKKLLKIGEDLLVDMKAATGQIADKKTSNTTTATSSSSVTANANSATTSSSSSSSLANSSSTLFSKPNIDTDGTDRSTAILKRFNQ
jgi:hypothetical protein